MTKHMNASIPYCRGMEPQLQCFVADSIKSKFASKQK